MSKQSLFFLLFYCFPFTLIAQQENPDPAGTWELTHFGSPSTATLDDPADLEIIPPGNTIPPKDFKPVPILWKFDGKDRLMVRQLKTYFKGLNYRIDGNTITVDHNIHYDIHQLSPESMVLTSRRVRSISVDTFYFKKTSEEPGIFDSIATSMAIRQLGPLRFDGVYLSTTKGNNEKIQLLFRFYPDSTFIMVPVRGQVGNEPVHYTRFNRRDIEEFQFPFNQVLHLNLIEDRAITKFIDEYPVVMEFSFEEDQLTVVLKEFDPSEDKPIGSLELTQTFFPVGGLPYYFDTSQNDKAGQEAFEEEIGETSEAAKDKPEIKPENMPRFPGCEDLKISAAEKKRCADYKMLNFIYQNIRYPAKARRKGIEGTCVVRFNVERDGSISNPKIVRDIGGGCGEEVLRIVKLMNQMGFKWIPGTVDGEPVRVQFNLPVKFRVL